MSQSSIILASFGGRMREFRNRLGLSQEELGFRCRLDRTYISDIERGKRNVSLINISALARALQVEPYQLLDSSVLRGTPPSYSVRDGFTLNCGFEVTGMMVCTAAMQVAEELEALPFSLYRSIDLKALSGIVGALFATHIARLSGGIINPIEKGHPDVIPAAGASATEMELRNYGQGLEIKCTVGSVKKGTALSTGDSRLDHLNTITWQAHHREVKSLMGLVADFWGRETSQGRFPLITAVYFSSDLALKDWREISGTKGRNTKVTGMTASGKRKMWHGWVITLADSPHFSKYQKLLARSTPLN